MVSSIIALILMQTLSLEIARGQVQLELPESYVVDIQYLTGGSKPDQPGVYGTKGEFYSLNKPGGRERHSMCINPLNGNILLFGGFGHDERGGIRGSLNDLWEYDTDLKRWKWLSGSKTLSQPGYYGQLNVASVENVPGARQEHAMVSDPSRKSVWLFGGTGFFGYYDDLWEWQSESGLWIWRNGNGRTNQPVVYKEDPGLGIKATPGGRFGHDISLHLETGTLVLFGGAAYFYMNDLWYFNMIDAWWFCVSRGEANMTDGTPQKRAFHSLSLDQSSNLLYLFGGFNGVEPFNDFWSWNMQRKDWTQIKQNLDLSETRVSSNLSEHAIPRRRFAQSMAIHERTGQLVIFGGDSVDMDNNAVRLNDVWLYEPRANNWVWINGSNVPNARGKYTKPVIIGSRSYHTLVLKTDQNSLFIFGGHGFGNNEEGFLSDLWKLTINITCPASSAVRGWNCIPCHAGSYVNGDQCTPCPPGYSSADPVTDTCIKCAPNTYQPLNGEAQCLDCPSNAVCTSTDYACNAGYTLHSSGSGCLACPEGFWKSERGNQVCSKCSKYAMICESTRCLLVNNRVCPVNSLYHFWLDNPELGLIILFSAWCTLFLIAFSVGLSRSGVSVTTDSQTDRIRTTQQSATTSFLQTLMPATTDT